MRLPAYASATHNVLQGQCPAARPIRVTGQGFVDGHVRIQPPCETLFCSPSAAASPEISPPTSTRAVITTRMSATEEIFHLTNTCALLLAESQSVQSLTKDDWIGRRLADFNLWAAGIGASTKGHASLDHRVRDRPDVKNVFIGILNTIKESAELCLGEFSADNIKHDARKHGVTELNGLILKRGRREA